MKATRAQGVNGCHSLDNTPPENKLHFVNSHCELTIWDFFDQQDLQENRKENRKTVLFYIKNCMDTVTAEKWIQSYFNQNPG